ncbi:MAG: DUF4116 domain-containing protein [Desulfovibrio sp.]|nr:DUF4116 domain-containing protein [Desulfovibrio sp.]
MLAAERLRMPELCMEAVRKDGMAMKFVPEWLRTPALCLEAVWQNVLSIRYAPELSPSGTAERQPAERPPRRLTSLCLRRSRSGWRACAGR